VVAPLCRSPAQIWAGSDHRVGLPRLCAAAWRDIVTNDEAIAVLELAVKIWHEVAADHDTPVCNCFREDFGQALMEAYQLPLYGEEGEE
jgi:hypothetical protein